MSLPPLKEHLIAIFHFFMKLLYMPLPILRKQRMKYLKTVRRRSNNTPIARNRFLMEHFPAIKKNHFLYFLLNRDFKPIGIRLLMFIVSGVWFAIFPIYLFVIYMYERGFFSYEFFTAGVFGLKSFFLVMLLLMLFISIHLYGFLLIGRVLCVDYIKSGKLSVRYRLLFWLCVAVGAFFHLWLLSINKPKLFSVLLASSLILILYFCTFIKINKVDGVVSWVPSAVFLFVSISLPFFNTANVAEAVEIGLRKFSVGPGKVVSVFDKSDTEAVAIGELLLWSPEFVYFVDEQKKLHAYPTKNGTHIVVEDKQNKRVN